MSNSADSHSDGPAATSIESELEAARARCNALQQRVAELSSELVHMERLDRRLLLRRGSVQTTLSNLLEAIAGRLPGARTVVALAAPGVPDTLHVNVVRGLPDSVVGATLDTSRGPIGQTLRGGFPRSFPGGRLRLGPTIAATDTVTVVPLLVVDKGTGAADDGLTTTNSTTGAIVVITEEGDSLEGTDLEFLRRLGVHGAVLVANARLLEGLRASEQTYRTMVERAHLGMALLARDARVVQTNGPMGVLLQGELEADSLFVDAVHDADRDLVQAHLDQAVDASLEPATVHLIAGDERVPVQLSVTPIREVSARVSGYVVIARDLTRELAVDSERHAMARRVQQAEKLSSVGQFVAGIAHELNNPLTVVVGYAELLTDDARLSLRQKASAGQVLQHARRCARIVSDLLIFAHEEASEPEPFQLADVVMESIAALRSRRGEGTAVATTISPDLAPILGSPHALTQALTNILDNAFDAAGLTAREPDVRITLQQDQKVQRVTVEDNGPGMAEPARVFDPFYTTKPIGKGTGLGLSICYGIIRDHEGDLFAENMPGGGARITLRLPEAPRSRMDLPALPAAEALPSDASVGLSLTRRRLLVVDDEPAILALAEEALRPMCDVVTAETVEEALERMEHESFDVILTDLRLPAGLTGADFHELLTERWPEMVPHLAFMTGDTVGQATQAFLDRVTRPCLKKPFKLSQLTAFVRAMLDGVEDASS